MIFFHPRAASYDFGPGHPLRPERLSRSMALLRHCAPDLEVRDPGAASEADVLRVHSDEFLETVQRLSADPCTVRRADEDQGFSSGDNPPFKGMYEAALAYSGASVTAARAVNDGAPVACTIMGGLHHARRSEASGFCIFNDPAMACSVLRERFERVAYVDIDLHHGDGVQWIFYDDPTVMTYSIHESGRFLYPGTGFVRESGAGCTKLNVPLHPGTTGDTWLWAVRATLPLAIDRFRPEAIVLQMGADPHFLDPLGHLEVAAQEWLEAVALVRDFGLPTVALGGGGYDMTTVPRMWVAAILTMLHVPFADRIVPPAAPVMGTEGDRWQLEDLVPTGTFSDLVLPKPRNRGRREAEEAVSSLKEEVIANMERTT